MNKIIWILLLFAQIAGAKVLSASYEVSFGIFQTMGTADAQLEIRDNETYTIRIEARTVGLAKVLSKNRVEVYESHGNVVNGKLVPEKYLKIRQTNAKKTVKIYTFDHPHKTVWKESITNDKRHKEKNDFYAQEDILSLFFNLKHYSQAQQNRAFYAIGGNKTDGKIDVEFPKGVELERMKKALGEIEGNFLKVILNDQIFASTNGELLINLDKSGLCETAILEDVLFFGDIVGKRVR